ncbi:histidinol-phosphate transaminase [Vibrio sp. qd031]|uniref:histidinol-phosphate transaminase n=1 Tax=Vibrio sp. qd031 TaxID=1603038 RepID=UPI000A0F72FC|nr:histidinol-phosphate transaminase [Vibrio sp. qd031]
MHCDSSQTSKNPASLAPKAIQKLIPYQSARRIGGEGNVWLNANELEHAIDFGQRSEENRYPDFLPQTLASAYQQYAQTTHPVVAVRGADEAIDLIIRSFCQPQRDSIVISSPTYAMYQFCADAFYIDCIDVPLTEQFSLNTKALAQQAATSKVIFVCNPNNPTGNVHSIESIEQLLKQIDGQALVVVDEAYIEFSESPSAVGLIADYPNLVVIRTLSKAFSLAATRLGFIIASPQVMGIIERLIAPYPIPDCAATIGLAALSGKGIHKMLDATKALLVTKQRFIDSIKQLEVIDTIVDSHTNFVLLHSRSPLSLFEFLKQHGVVTRHQDHEPALRDHVRITIGSDTSMQLVETLIAQYNQHYLQQGRVEQ